MAIAKRYSGLLLAFGLVVAQSCKYDPHPPSGTQACASGSKPCPNGYLCSGGLCRIPADIPATNKDASGPAPDAPQASDGPGVSGSDTTTATSTGTNTGAACGGLNQTCCAGGVCTSAGTICSGQTYCIPCGALDQPCCSGNQCGDPLACTGGTCRLLNNDAGTATSTGTTTATIHDAGVDAATATFTNTMIVTVPITVHDAGTDAATATSTSTTTVTKTKPDAGSDASTSTGIATFKTIPFTVITTFPPISTGVTPATSTTTAAPSTH